MLMEVDVLGKGFAGMEAGQEEEEEEEEEYGGELFRRSFVREWAVLEGIVSSILVSGEDIAPDAFKKAQRIIGVYQEQGHLLEPHLEGVVAPLMELLRSKVSKPCDEAVDMEFVKRICCLVHKLITVCGYKTVLIFFPHQVSDLEMTVLLLERSNKEMKKCTTLEESAGEWETSCTLVLWLSILVLIPFDIASVDTALGYSSDSSHASSPLVEKMINLCKQYLSSAGPVREISGVLLSRLLTRPDMRLSLLSFVSWSKEALGVSQDDSQAVFLIPGTVSALAAIFKVGGRDVLVEIAAPAWEEANALLSSPLAQRSPLLRKLLIKLVQRIGLTYLPPKIASWRYVLGTKSLAHNLEEATPCLADERRDEDEGYEIPEAMEEIIEKLLRGLKDKDTVVRWSAAKGIGRVTGRLNSENADDVVASVLELFSPAESDAAWHGGCLALAELARRGLLLPTRLPEVMPVIIKALHYDARRGAHSVGAHVRDAAAYVCWAFARAYKPSLMSEHLKTLAPEMMAVACYDREVNCRRAASAAFQENVGRQGDFLHGIDVVNVSDYFAVGSRPYAYQHVAPYVAQFEEYRQALIHDLLQFKIRHWDKALRELAAVALSDLVKYDPTYFETSVLASLSSWSLSPDLNLRHGATLAAAEVTRALHECGHNITAEKEKVIAGIVPAIDKARLYRGKGGEIMRAAVSRLIECTAIARIPLSTKSRKILLDTLDDNLRHPNCQIQILAAAGFKAYVTAYLVPVTQSSLALTTIKQIQSLSDANPAKRRGSALALGSLGSEFLAPLWKDAIGNLCAACLEENVEERDPEARVNAVRALASICRTLAASVDASDFMPILRSQVVECLFGALNDYAIDNRGDVGSWIREAAMEALETCTYLLCDLGSEMVDETYTIRLFGGLIKQAAEKIDRIRDAGGKTVQTLLHKEGFNILRIPHKTELQEIFPSNENLLWSDPSVAFPRLVKLIAIPEYRSFVMSGLVVSVGGISQTLAKVSLAALLEFLTGQCKEGAYDPQTTALIASELVYLLKTSARNDRLALPIIRTIDALFNKGAFSNLKAAGDEFRNEVLELVQAELKGCRDVSKILCCINVLGGIASLQLQPAFCEILCILGHRYPKVRKVAAEQLYVLLIQADTELGSDRCNMAVELLLQTCWDGALETTKANKDKLLKLFDNGNEGEVFQEDVPAHTEAVGDENASYAALVDAVGY